MVKGNSALASKVQLDDGTAVLTVLCFAPIHPAQAPPAAEGGERSSEEDEGPVEDQRRRDEEDSGDFVGTEGW